MPYWVCHCWKFCNSCANMGLPVIPKIMAGDMQIIGLTGSIASGKSRVAYICGQMGLPVHDSDAAAHRLMAPFGVAVPAILDKFGAVGRLDTGIDRPALGKMIFANPKAKSELESILHPLIAADSSLRLGTRPSAASTRPPGKTYLSGMKSCRPERLPIRRRGSA